MGYPFGFSILRPSPPINRVGVECVVAHSEIGGESAALAVQLESPPVSGDWFGEAVRAGKVPDTVHHAVALMPSTPDVRLALSKSANHIAEQVIHPTAKPTHAFE